MMEQVRLCAVWPMENWLGSSMNHIQGWMTFSECCRNALEKGYLSGREGADLTDVIAVESLEERQSQQHS